MSGIAIIRKNHLGGSVLFRGDWAYIMALLYRILVQHMEEFQDQKKTVLTHIPSKYSVEMASKSEVVSSLSCKLAIIISVLQNRFR